MRWMSAGVIGSLRTLQPVAANTAFAIAGATWGRGTRRSRGAARRSP